MARPIDHEHALIIRNKTSGRSFSFEFSTLPDEWRVTVIAELNKLFEVMSKPQQDAAALAAIDTQISSLMEQKRIITGANKKADCGCGCGGC